jgi:hypothetical protein
MIRISLAVKSLPGALSRFCLHGAESWLRERIHLCSTRSCRAPRLKIRPLDFKTRFGKAEEDLRSANATKFVAQHILLR